MGPGPFDTETIYEGFFGRIDMRWVKDSDLMVVPIAPGPGPGPTYPVPLTEWHPRVQITYIEEAATLDKMWVDNGLKVDGRKFAWYDDNCTNDPTYDRLSMWIDPEFEIDQAKAYIIGRKKDNIDRSCLVEVTDHLGFTPTPPTYRVLQPDMKEEILTDVTSTDCRVLISSRIFKYTVLNSGNSFQKEYTVGIRYKDECTGDDDYVHGLHLYSHQAARPNSPLADEEYAHLSRRKSTYDKEGGFYENDFCFVYTCKDGQSEIYRPGPCKTLINHIGEYLAPNASFELGQYPSCEFDEAGGYLIRDLAYIGKYNMNSLAIAYKLPWYNYWAFDQYVEIIDWGYKTPQANLLHLQTPWNDHSVRLFTTAHTTSLDVFMEGRTFLMGGYVYGTNVMELGTQRRTSIEGGSDDMSCERTMTIKNDVTLNLLYEKIDKILTIGDEKVIVWTNIPTKATKKHVENTCTEERDIEDDPIRIRTSTDMIEKTLNN